MARSKKIYIFCDGGFGNRLNTLLSGLAIANFFEIRATVYWPRNNWCQAAFSDIFDNNLDTSEQSLSELAGTLNSTVALLHDQLGADTLRVPFRSAYAYTSLDDFSKQILTTGNDIFYYPALIPQWLPMELVVGVVRTCHYQAPIQEAVTNFVGKTIGQPFHGLHLRRTDLNVGFTDNEVQYIVREYPKEVFFVCSDDPIAEALAAAHPNVYRRPKRAYVDKRNSDGEWNALTADDDGRLYPCNIDRNAESVIDAVIDMLILAHGSIVGFSGSTFQNMARLYGAHAPMVSVEKPKLEIIYVSLNTSLGLMRTGAMSLGDVSSCAVALYNAGRKLDAIQLERAAIEHGRTKGINDINLFVLHYNLAAHLINGGFPFEASLYLEKALALVPGHAESKTLLTAARLRAGQADNVLLEPCAMQVVAESPRNQL
jgi:tetratricopeptide (TPR) repeat protein